MKRTPKGVLFVFVEGFELFKRRYFGKGEQVKTIEYRFYDAKELKQGECRAEQAQARADDYATRVGAKLFRETKTQRQVTVLCLDKNLRWKFRLTPLLRYS